MQQNQSHGAGDLESLRQEAEVLKAQIRVSILYYYSITTNPPTSGRENHRTKRWLDRFRKTVVFTLCRAIHRRSKRTERAYASFTSVLPLSEVGCSLSMSFCCWWSRNSLVVWWRSPLVYSGGVPRDLWQYFSIVAKCNRYFVAKQQFLPSYTFILSSFWRWFYVQKQRCGTQFFFRYLCL